jgi:hypothetical protein
MARTDLLGSSPPGSDRSRTRSSKPSRVPGSARSSPGHRRVAGATAAALREATVLHLVRAAPDDQPHRAPGPGDGVPDVSRRVPGADIGKDLVKVYERNGIECDNTDAGCCGAPWLHAGNVEGVHEGRREERRDARRRGPSGHRHRRAAADVQLRHQEGLPRPRRWSGRRTRRRTHLRRRRVPDQDPRGRRHRPRHRLPGRDRRVDHLPRALSPPGPGHRIHEP